MDSSSYPLRSGTESTYITVPASHELIVYPPGEESRLGILEGNPVITVPASHELIVYPPGEESRLGILEGNPVQESEAGAEIREEQGQSPDGQVVDGQVVERQLVEGQGAEVVTVCAPVRENVSFCSQLLSMWYLVVIIATPIILLPILLVVDDEYQRPARCGYTIAVMAVYWTTEVLPIAVTSLIPVVMLPLLGVLTARETSEAYFNDTSMLFLGGLLVAIAIEVWDVHMRLALLVLGVVGAEPRCLLLGMTLVTWFLSMWISSTATTAMMMTIVQALLKQFQNIGDTPIEDTPTTEPAPKHDENGNYSTLNGHTGTADSAHTLEAGTQKNSKSSEEEMTRLKKVLSVTVAYAANIGGIASLTGSGPNLILFDNAQREFEKVGLESPVSFTTWLVYGLPLSLLLVIVMWLWMNVYFLRCRGGCSCCMCDKSTKDQQIERVNQVLKEEYKKLGPVTYAQGTVLVSFVTLAVLWIVRDVGGIGGWGDWFPAGYVSDSTPSLLMGILMFVLPSALPSTKDDPSAPRTRITPLLNWRHVHEKMPWSLFLLLGGGYAIAHAATESGLSDWLGQQLLVFRHLDPWLIILIICYIVTFATEVTSNTAMATLLMPILAQMALSLKMNPLFFMFPAAITTSFAFMLPVASPPNAIVFAAGYVRVIDMVGSGIFMNLVCVPLLVLATATWANAYFHFDITPPEFLFNQTISNVTDSFI